MKSKTDIIETAQGQLFLGLYGTPSYTNLDPIVLMPNSYTTTEQENMIAGVGATKDMKNAIGFFACSFVLFVIKHKNINIVTNRSWSLNSVYAR